MTAQSEISQLIEDLFRRESGKLVSVLTRIFGPENIDLAEDVVQDALIEAMQNWSNREIPANPTAWLFRVAKNKALNILNRKKYQQKYFSDVAHFLRSEWTAEPALHNLFSDEQVFDDQLRMMFTCCHPAISSDSQVALTLKTLCGFSIPEIAKAFLTTEENISKRLVRARQKIRRQKIPFEVPVNRELDKRLEAVLETIYLLFNEGYSASSGRDLIRFEVCGEAIRLAEIIILHLNIRDKTNVYALLALMQLNASRFKARQDRMGNILILEKQNRLLWDYSLMEKGFLNLEKSATENQFSIYHILAAISAYHCAAQDYDATNWKGIIELYDKLIQISDSQVVLLNRAIALSKVYGYEKGLAELEKINKTGALGAYYLFYSVQAEFYIEMNQFSKAADSLRTAISLAPLQAEILLLEGKLKTCLEKIS
jgi:RNA polymerase sigma factor (sigma-70 family)